MRKNVLLLGVILVVAVGAVLYLQGHGITQEAPSDEIPTEVVGDQTVSFQLTVGQPGTWVTVTTDMGKLSQSPDVVIEGKSIGEVKQMPDSSTSADTPKKRSYKVSAEGQITFNFTGDLSYIGQTATIRVSRSGEDWPPYPVKILAPSSPEEVVGSIDRIELKNAITIEGQDGSKMLSLRFELVNTAGETVTLHGNTVLFLRCRIVNANGTETYLQGEYLPSEGDSDDGTFAHVTDVEYWIPDSGVLDNILLFGTSETPITLQVSVSDDEHEYLTRTFSVYAGMKL